MRLFHPRNDNRNNHLTLGADSRFLSTSEMGRTTIFFLDINDDERIIIRQRLSRVRRFPK